MNAEAHLDIEVAEGGDADLISRHVQACTRHRVFEECVRTSCRGCGSNQGFVCIESNVRQRELRQLAP